MRLIRSKLQTPESWDSDVATEGLLQQLPLTSATLRTDEALPPDAWFGGASPQGLLPALAAPQLKQELEELVRFARQEGIVLLPGGSFSSQLTPAAPRETACLVVRPGSTSVWAGADVRNRTAWMPSSMTVAEAEASLRAEQLTLSAWHLDGGTLGGNWINPRGSFAVREFGEPAARRLGVECLFGNGEWLRMREAPRTAAGPHVGRALSAVGSAAALITAVRLAVEPLGEQVEGEVVVDDPDDAARRLRHLVYEDIRPTALLLWKPRDRWTLRWRQNVWNGWTEHCWNRACGEFGFEDKLTEPLPALSRDARPVRVPWSQLSFDASAVYAGPAPDGLMRLDGAPLTSAMALRLLAATRDWALPGEGFA